MAKCPTGYFQPNSGADTCKKIGAGNYSDAVGPEQPCPRGTKCINGILTPCEAGTYQSSIGASVCIPCPTSMYSSVANATKCSPVDGPTYFGVRSDDSIGFTSRELASICVPGQHVLVDTGIAADRVCAGCMAGISFSNTDNAVSCAYVTRCEDGIEYESVAPTTSSDRQCVNCSFISCPDANTYRSGNCTGTTNSYSCKPCGDGSRPRADGTGCEACPAGTFGSGGICSFCDIAADKYQDSPGQTTCKSSKVCGPGSAVLQQVSSASNRVCVECLVTSGEWQNSTNAAACKVATNCEPGTVISASLTASSDRTCVTCDHGTYQDRRNAAECEAVTVCKADEVVVAESTVSTDRLCTTEGTCRPGQYISRDRIDIEGIVTPRVCAPCGPGTFSTTVNSITCTAMTDCDPGWAVDIDGTQTTDRSCKKCPDDTFSLGRDTLVCREHRICAKGSFVSVEATSSTDRACSTCSPGTFTDEINADTCITTRSCNPGKYQLHPPPTAERDRACGECILGVSFTNVSNAATCSVVHDCKAGSFTVAPPTLSSDRSCEECKDGTFSTESNTLTCLPLTDCPVGTHIIAPTSSSEDRRCESCIAGVGFSTSINEASCERVKVCQPGERVVRAPTPSMNRQCAPCDTGTFSSGKDADACTAVTICVDGAEYESNFPTSTSDRVCSDCDNKACELGTEFRIGSCAGTSNKFDCVPVSTCSPGTYISVRATLTSDRHCSDCDVGEFTDEPNRLTCMSVSEPCPAGKYEITSPTGSVNRACADCKPGHFCVGGDAEPIAVRGACQDSEIQSSPPTSSTDRICVSLVGSAPWSCAGNGNARKLVLSAGMLCDLGSNMVKSVVSSCAGLAPTVPPFECTRGDGGLDAVLVGTGETPVVRCIESASFLNAAFGIYVTGVSGTVICDDTDGTLSAATESCDVTAERLNRLLDVWASGEASGSGGTGGCFIDLALLAAAAPSKTTTPSEVKTVNEVDSSPVTSTSSDKTPISSFTPEISTTAAASFMTSTSTLISKTLSTSTLRTSTVSTTSFIISTTTTTTTTTSTALVTATTTTASSTSASVDSFSSISTSTNSGITTSTNDDSTSTIIIDTTSTTKATTSSRSTDASDSALSTRGTTLQSGTATSTSGTECPKNCGSVSLGGGTCGIRPSDGVLICKSCNSNRIRQKGVCLLEVHCRSRTIQSGKLKGQGCKCSNIHCHNCKRRSESQGGDTCTVCRDGWFLLNGDCVEECPPEMASSGISLFRRRCNVPFICRSSKIYDKALDGSQTLIDRGEPFGCRCPAPGNKVGGNCFACEHRAGGVGDICLRCSGGKFLMDGVCLDECPTGYTPVGQGNYGKVCLEGR